MSDTIASRRLGASLRCITPRATVSYEPDAAFWRQGVRSIKLADDALAYVEPDALRVACFSARLHGQRQNLRGIKCLF